MIGQAQMMLLKWVHLEKEIAEELQMEQKIVMSLMGKPSFQGPLIVDHQIAAKPIQESSQQGDPLMEIEKQQ